MARSLSESLPKGSGEPIELDGEVGIEGSEVGIDEKTSAGATSVSMDLDRDTLKAKRRDLALEGAYVVRVCPHDDAARLPREGEGLSGNRRDLSGGDGERFAEQALGHGARELDCSVEVALVAPLLLDAKFDPRGGELGRRVLLPLLVGLVSKNARFGSRLGDDGARPLLGGRERLGRL